MRKLSIPILIFPLSLFSQSITIDFENQKLNDWQELHENRWGIDLENPLSGTASLYHAYDDTITNTDAIAYPHQQILFDSSETVWEFSLKYDYNPSGNNNWAFCLASTNGVSEMSPSGNTNAYYLGVNFTGTDDYIQFWKKVGTTNTKLLNPIFNWEDNNCKGDTLRFKVVRSQDANWSFYIKKFSEAGWSSLGTCFDNGLNKSDYIGVYYKYTKTADQVLWMDDIKLEGFFYADTQAPTVTQHYVTEKNILEIEFSEEVDTVSMPVFILNSSLQPTNIKWKSSSLVQLTFSANFELNNTLQITDLSDVKGNIANNIQLDFTFYLPQIYDVVITEIMADPTDPVGLPEEEYLEICNQTNYTINVSDWILSVGDNACYLPQAELQPNHYYVLTSNAENWSEITESVIEINPFPALTNSGNLIQLKDKYGTLIHAVEYTDDWYQSGYKQEGGWFLEMINIDEPCVLDGNWKESENEFGGTPGAKNSVASQDILFPKVEVEKVSVTSRSSLLVNFSTTMDSSVICDKNNYNISPEIEIDHILSPTPFFNSAIVFFQEQLNDDEIYTISFNNGLTSCFGQTITSADFDFGYPMPLDTNDVVVNEILFDATETVPEFIELYNKTNKVIELYGTVIGLEDETTGEVKKLTLLFSSKTQILPGDFHVITENKEKLLESFPDSKKSSISENSQWPALSNEGGIIVFNNKNNGLIEKVQFSPNMQYDLLIENRGVALERINPEISGMLKSNWHSASSDANYATPTLQNSQFRNTNITDKQIILSTKEISPDNDGHNDFLQIEYQFSDQGYAMTIEVFNRGGTKVAEVINNEPCGTTGAFTWNGLSNEGGRLPMGYYIVFIKAINPNGKAINKKEAVLILPDKK